MRVLFDILVLDQVCSDLFFFYKGVVNFVVVKQQYQEQVYYNVEDMEVDLEEVLNYFWDREFMAGISIEMEIYLVLVQFVGLKIWVKGIDFLWESIIEDCSFLDEGWWIVMDFFLQEWQQYLVLCKVFLLVEFLAFLFGGIGYEFY